MRGLCKAGLALGLVAFVVSPAMAQRGGGGGGFGGAGLLQNKSVQEELKMDKDQVDKVTAALTKVREDHKDDLAKLRDQNTSREDRAAVMKTVNEANQKALAGILKPAQEKRLKQIQHQLAGLAAFADPEVQKALDLKDKQKDELKTLADDFAKERREIGQNAGGDFQEARKKITALQKEKMETAMKTLTDEQKKTYKEMLGEPFEIKFEPRKQ
jgi:hypothetical protein